MNEAPRISGATALYGIVGHPVSGSLSPAMQNAAFGALGLDAVYVAFPVSPEHLAVAIPGLVAAGLRGFNVTVPHKTAVLPLLHQITPQARAIGAVNTVKCEAGRLLGSNTDGEGFLLALRHDLDWAPAGKRVLLLGAGGSARAIGHALLDAGIAALDIANRTPERAEALAVECRTRFPAAEIRVLPLGALAGVAPHLLVNTTTVGMGDGRSPVELESLSVREAVVDIVYNPLETPLLAQARALGLQGANGIGMLLFQGWVAFRFWTDREAPLEVMRAALPAGLGSG